MSTTPPTMRPAPTIRRSPAGCSSKPTRPKWSRTREATTDGRRDHDGHEGARADLARGPELRGQHGRAQQPADPAPPRHPAPPARLGPGEVARGGADREEARGAEIGRAHV